MVNMIFWCLCTAAVLAMFIYYFTRLKRFKTIFFGAFTGVAALILLNCFGDRFNAYLPLNLFNVCGSAILGVPFIICIVIFKFI